MTKSGIGTQQQQQQQVVSQNSTPTNNNTIGTAEIPIWVADKKKWVTGISKKTTINDLIYAILKQCQLVPTSTPETTVSLIEQIASQYVLTEYQFDPDTSNSSTETQFVLSSQRILDGDSKVYKHLTKWSQILTSNNLMLKILQRELVNEPPIDLQHQTPGLAHSNHSLASKLLKKFGVSNQNLNNQKSLQISPTPTPTYKYVEVKLPQKSIPTSSSTNLLNSRNFDPSTQKAFICNTILDRESRLKQQKEKFQLLDELLKETEKKAKNSSNITLLNTVSPNNSAKTTPNQMIDLNDIYCHFPEMCTHNLNEVEDFTLMCCQLFQLEEAIKTQKQVLNNLEQDLQRELNSQNQLSTFTTLQPQTQAQVNLNESPETLELRKEVNQSREQTRVQCKQLHDLDLRMRQNEQNLMLKEQQLNQLLEELYVQEIYTDNNGLTAHEGEEDINNMDKINLDGLVELKIVNNSNNELKNKTIDDMMLTNQQQYQIQITNNLVNKSLSYGSLLNAQQQQQQQQQSASPNNKFQNLQIKSIGKMKTSPSLDISSNKSPVIKIESSVGDQLGETDSGISSMSSETATTTTTTTNSSSSSSSSSTSSTSSTMATLQQTTTILSSNSSPNTIPILNSTIFYSNTAPKSLQQQQFQIQQQQQQQQQQRQFAMHQKQSQVNKQTKSVLETLV